MGSQVVFDADILLLARVYTQLGLRNTNEMRLGEVRTQHGWTHQLKLMNSVRVLTITLKYPKND